MAVSSRDKEIIDVREHEHTVPDVQGKEVEASYTGIPYFELGGYVDRRGILRKAWDFVVQRIAGTRTSAASRK
jgi:hypothetical protein